MKSKLLLNPKLKNLLNARLFRTCDIIRCKFAKEQRISRLYPVRVIDFVIFEKTLLYEYYSNYSERKS